MEEQAGPADQHLGSFRHGDANCQPAVLRAAGGSRLAVDDEQLLDALAHVVEASDRFSFGIVTNTLSVTEQLDFGYRLTSLAGRIRARVEKATDDHRLRTPDGDPS